MPEPYATYTHGRRPHFKLHSQLAHATSAAHNNKRSGVIIYERRGGRWEQIARFEQHYYPSDPSKSLMPQTCDGCRLSTVKPSTRNYHNGTPTPINTAEQVLERRNGRLVKPLNVLTLCPDCKRGMGY